jgi:phosphatidylglycerophosphate synthase
MHSLPNLVTLVRIVLIPIVVTCLRHKWTAPALFLFGVVCVSDLLDGYLARKLDAESRLGAYLDATADFVFILILISYFCVGGLVPVTLPILTVVMFGQFVATPVEQQLVYDPIGKHFGALLFLSILALMLFPCRTVACVCTEGIIGAAALSLCSRFAHFAVTAKEQTKHGASLLWPFRPEDTRQASTSRKRIRTSVSLVDSPCGLL